MWAPGARSGRNVDKFQAVGPTPICGRSEAAPDCRVPDPHRMSCRQHDRHGRPHYLCRLSRGKIRRPRCNEGRDCVQGFFVAPHLDKLDKLDKSIDGLGQINSPPKMRSDRQKHRRKPMGSRRFERPTSAMSRRSQDCESP